MNFQSDSNGLDDDDQGYGDVDLNHLLNINKQILITGVICGKACLQNV